MLSRVARVTALSLPFVLAGVLLCAGGWHIRDGQVVRLGSASGIVPGGSPSTAGTPASASAMPGRAELAQHLSPSVPWPAWAGLIVLILLPAVASVSAWSGTRRRRGASSAAWGAAP